LKSVTEVAKKHRVSLSWVSIMVAKVKKSPDILGELVAAG
jgi:hypothetical protein